MADYGFPPTIYRYGSGITVSRNIVEHHEKQLISVYGISPGSNDSSLNWIEIRIDVNRWLGSKTLVKSSFKIAEMDILDSNGAPASALLSTSFWFDTARSIVCRIVHSPNTDTKEVSWLFLRLKLGTQDSSTSKSLVSINGVPVSIWSPSNIDNATNLSSSVIHNSLPNLIVLDETPLYSPHLESAHFAFQYLLDLQSSQNWKVVSNNVQARTIIYKFNNSSLSNSVVHMGRSQNIGLVPIIKSSTIVHGFEPDEVYAASFGCVGCRNKWVR